MMLIGLIVVLIAGGVIAWAAESRRAGTARWIALAAVVFDGGWLGWAGATGFGNSLGSRWLATVSYPWIPMFRISFELSLDGLSLVMLALTFFLGAIAVLVSWREITERVGFYFFNLLLTLAGVTGVFLATDLFLFYFFWELMLVPMYLLIAIWGHENRRYASFKFFLFTQLGGLLMLVAILGLVFFSGVHSFSYEKLLDTKLDPRTAMLLMLGFFVAFAIKLPAIPLHTWLPDAHTEAPTAASVILAGLLLKTGAYGLLRFVLPLFPYAAREFAPVAMTIGVIGILYGAVLAFAQTDLKRMVAYTSVSHMGFVLLGAFAFTAMAYRGVVMQMLCHGLSTGALFVLAGVLQERLHTRDLRRMGGLWAATPRLGAVALFFVLASLGLPGLGNFVAEFLVLAGSFRANPIATSLATIGFVLATVYALALMQRAFFGARAATDSIADLSPREWLIFGAMMAGLIYLGLFPDGVFRLLEHVVRAKSML